MRLFIAEKPSVAKAIAGELGQTSRGDGFIQCGDDYVTWCFGHMLEQAEPDVYLPEDVPRNSSGKKIWRAEDLPIIPETWITEPKPDAKQQLAAIGKLIKNASLIVNAGDPDREGQLLVDAVLEHFGSSKPVKRFWVSAQDSVSVQRGLNALKDNETYKGWAEAALGRGRADWLIGMNLSRAYTLRAQRGGGQVVLSIGRVQTPTLALVVQRDREIEAFKSLDFFKIGASFEHANGSFVAGWIAKEDQPGLDPEGRLIDKKEADKLTQAVTGKPGNIIAHSDTPKKDPHPRAFALSGITLVASKKFGYSADEVLKVCQALYDQKLTSYPRTDCDYLPESQHADAPKVLAALKKVNPDWARFIEAADPSIKSKTWNDAKITAHHGIIPTMHVGAISGLSESQRNIYGLVVRAYLAQFFPLHEYMSTEILLEVAGETFGVKGKTVTRKGWKSVYGSLADDDDAPVDDDGDQALPPVKKGDPVSCAEAFLRPTKTKPPERYTEGTLVMAMANIHKYVTESEHKKILKEGDGIGTEATRASILTELKNKRFLETKGNAIVSTQLGRGLIDALPEVVKSPVLTALYERTLKQIEQNNGSLSAFIEKQEAFIRDQVAKANDGAVTIAGASGPPCPKCKTGSLRRFPRKLEGFFWSCTRYQEGCDATFDDKGGKPVPRVPVVVSQVHKCGTCGKGLVRRIGQKFPGKPALPTRWTCSGYPECTRKYPDLKGKPDFSKS